MSSFEAPLPERTGTPSCPLQPDAPGAAEISGASSRERDIQYAKCLVDKTPDIREDRVAAAKHALQAGRLCLSGTDLAERLLADDLHREDVSGG